MKNLVRNVRPWYSISCLLMIVVLSCKETNEPSPELEKNSERARIIKLFEERGFVQVPLNNARTSAASPSDIENLSFSTYAEAEAYLDALEALSGTTLYSPIDKEQDPNSSNPNTSCDEDGYTYYIKGATSTSFAEINIIYQRANGTISSVTSYENGWSIYSWDQLGYNVINPHVFCIDAQVTVGVDIDGLPTSFTQECSLKAYLNSDGSCNGQVVFKWGLCYNQ